MRKTQPSTLKIKKRLLERGLSVAELARQIQRPRVTVSRVIHASAHFPKVREQIHEALDL